MGVAYLVGGGSSSGIRHKEITWANYQALPNDQKNNPYIIWIVTDRTATDANGNTVNIAKTKITVWETYQSLPDDEKLDSSVVWVISDKNPSDLLELGYGYNTGQGSQLYNIDAELDTGEIRKMITSLQSQISSLQNTITSLQNTISSQSTTISALRSKITTNTNDIKELKQEISSLQS